MTQMNDYAPIALLPSQHTGTGSPFVAPPFEMAFRRCEKLFWEGHQLQDEMSNSLARRGIQNVIEQDVKFIERRLCLQLALAEMGTAKPLLEREVESMSRRLDPRYAKCSDADCLEGWLEDGAKINVLKARTLAQKLDELMTGINGLLAKTAETACRARDVLTRESEKASSGPTSLSLDLGLPDSR